MPSSISILIVWCSSTIMARRGGRAPKRRAAQGRHSLRSLEDDNLPGRAEDHRHDGADGPRRADQSSRLPSLCGAGAGARTQPRGDIVVMDNLSSHKGPAVCQAIAATGARLLYLPPYSPEFNLI